MKDYLKYILPKKFLFITMAISIYLFFSLNYNIESVTIGRSIIFTSVLFFLSVCLCIILRNWDLILNIENTIIRKNYFFLFIFLPLGSSSFILIILVILRILNKYFISNYYLFILIAGMIIINTICIMLVNLKKGIIKELISLSIKK
jgi:hypothetical protein